MIRSTMFSALSDAMFYAMGDTVIGELRREHYLPDTFLWKKDSLYFPPKFTDEELLRAAGRMIEFLSERQDLLPRRHHWDSLLLLYKHYAGKYRADGLRLEGWAEANDRVIHADSHFEQSDHLGQLQHVEHADSSIHTQATRNHDGMTGRMVGTPQQGEENVEGVCKRLARALTDKGDTIWEAESSAPEGPEEGVDWYLKDRSGKRCGVQVTRIPGPWWGIVGATGEYFEGAAAAEMGHQIWVAIQSKLGSQDRRVILALDGGQPGIHEFEDGVEAFWARHGDEFRKRVKFAEVWLLGYSRGAARQLWVSPHSTAEPGSPSLPR